MFYFSKTAIAKSKIKAWCFFCDVTIIFSKPMELIFKITCQYSVMLKDSQDILAAIPDHIFSSNIHTKYVIWTHVINTIKLEMIT